MSRGRAGCCPHRALVPEKVFCWAVLAACSQEQRELFCHLVSEQGRLSQLGWWLGAETMHSSLQGLVGARLSHRTSLPTSKTQLPRPAGASLRRPGKS